MKHWLPILIIISSFLPLKGDVLFTESFDVDGALPAEWTTDNDNNWQVQSGYDGNTTPPALSFTWSPQIFDYSNDVQTPDIDVGDNAGVLIEFDFALDFWGASDHTNGMTISYDGGNGWVPVLNYEIGPDAGFVSIDRRTESFTADIESGSDLKLKWTAYGTDSYWIDSWIIDNVKIITLPQLTSVTIESANEDPSTAVEGTNIWLNFMADSDLSGDPYVQINGNACNIDNLGGTNWVAYYIVQASDPDGPLQFTIDFTDVNGVDGSTVKQTTNGSSVVVDNSEPPSFTVGGVTASGGIVEAGTWASTNTEVQLEVNVPQDSAVVNFDYIEGNSLSFDGSNDEVTIPAIASYQVTDALTVETWVKPNSWSDNEGFLNFATDNGGTEAGFGFVFFATGWRFYLKTTINSIDYAEMAETSTPVGQWTHLAATYDGTKVRIYRNGSVIDSTDAMGNVEWTGAPGNVTLGSFTKGGTTKYFDGNMDDVRLWNIVRSAAEIKASKEITLNGDETGLVGYWQIDETSGGTTVDYTSNNNTATLNGASWASGESPIYFQEPVYDNTVIVGSLFQMRTEIDENRYEAIGPQIPIVIGDVTSGTKTITASAVDFAGVTGYAHGGVGSFSALLFDVAGNYSEGDTSATTLTIDLIASNPNPVSISSNNTFSHLVSDGDIITITMEYDEDVEIPNVTVEGNDNASETDEGGEQFSATYIIDGSESEGSIDFEITTTDYLGNPGTHSGSTNGTSVSYDHTAPDVSPVTIISNNPDTQWAKVGDTVKLDFSGNEILYETTVSLATSSIILYDTSDVAYNGASECVGGEIITDNLKLWLDANDVDGDGISEGLYEDNIVDGDVPLWADKSGNGADVIEEAGQGIPSLVENQFNGQAALRFNKAEEDMLVHDLGGNKWNASEFSLLIVFQQNNTPENFDSFFSNGDINDNNYFQITHKTNDGHFKFYSGGEINFEPWDNDLKLYGLIANTSGTSTIVDGNVANWADITNGRQFDKYKINRNRLNFQYNDSFIAEVLLYDRELTELELTKTYKYLGNKYGQTFTNDTTIVHGNKEMDADDPVGPIDITIQYNDCAGNSGVETIETTDGSYVVFDPDPPEAFTIGTVVSTGGNIVTNAWNSTNTGLDIQVPVAANDTTLNNGTIQLWAKVGTNAYELFGDPVTIIPDDFGTNKIISLLETQVEAITGYAEEDTIYVKAFMTDRPGNETESTLSENTLVIDETAPTVLSSHIESNNADSTKAKVDDEITLTFQTSEIIQSPTATIASGDATIADLGSFNWSAVYTMLETDDEGIIAFTVNELVDDRGNPAEGFADATDESEVAFDRTKPSIDYAHLSTNNSWNQSWALEGNIGRIQANTSEDLLSSSCTFNGNVTTLNWYNAQEFDVVYTFSNSDTEGILVFELTFIDSAGNQGDTVITSTNNSYIIFDMTTPADFTVGDVSATGGNEIATFWNSTNTGIDILVPIDSDSTLDSGRVQMWGKVGSNPFESIGDYVFIESEEVGDIKTMSLIEDSVEALTGYTEDDTLFFKAVIYDIPGNETEGSLSTTILLIDETPPSLISASYESNFSDSSLATVGHLVTLTFETDVEIQTPSATISTQNAIISDLGSNQWSASYEMQDSDTEGIIPFQIATLTDSRGNPTEGTSSTTNGTIVTFDNTKPTLSSVNIVSNNADTSWAKVGDTITVAFKGNELLINQIATIVTQTAAITSTGFANFYALNFDGADDYITLPDFSYLDDLSFSAWFKIDTRDTWERIFDFGRGSSGDIFLSTKGNRTGGNLELTIHPFGETYTIDPGVTCDDDQWHHVVFTYDKGGVGMVLYIDGQNLGSNAYNTYSFSDFDSGQNFHLGKSNWNDPYYDGEMDEVAIWDTALSAEAISDLYNGLNPLASSDNYNVSSNLIGYWNFNEGSGNMVYDISGNGNNGTIYGAVWTTNLPPNTKKYYAKYQLTDTDPEGEVPFEIVVTDSVGLVSDPVIQTTDESLVIFDRTKPLLSSVHFVSNNDMNESIAVGGDIATMTFEPNEPITSLVLTVAESNVPVIENVGIYTGEYTVLGTEPSGPLDFSITFNDRAGNIADSVLSTTDGSFVSHDVGPPDLIDVSIISSNTDSSWAKVGDTITVTFSGTEILANIELTTVGTISSIENPSGLIYFGTYVMQETDPEGVISFSITYTDLSGQTGPDYNASTNNTEVQFDKTVPVVTPVILASDNVYGDSLAALGSIVTLQFSLNEAIRTVTTHIANQDQIVNSNGLDYDASHTFSESDMDGWVSFIITCEDSAGNAPENIISTSDGSVVRFDGTPPFMNSVTISSNHSTHASLAGIGDEIKLIAVSAESLRTITIQIAENNPDSQSSVDWTLTSTYTIQGTEIEGYIPFTIDIMDWVGNEGIQVDSTTDDSYVFFDMTAPAAFYLDSVYTTGGTIFSGFWNSTNLEMVLDIPISEDDETLIDGSVQSQVRFDSGNFVNLGVSNTIESLGTLQVNISRETFTSMDGFIENGNAEFTAIIQDKAGNETTGTTYNTVYHIDETIPELFEVTVISNNELSSNWATIGNTFTLSYTSSEGLNNPTTLILEDTINTTQSNNATMWTGEHILSEIDPDGIVSFVITYIDTAGNSGSDMSETTDGSLVQVDRTSPQVLNLLEGRQGEDITYYNEGDSLTLYWDQSDASSGIQESYYALGTDSNLTDVQGWTNGNTLNYGGWNQLNLSNDTRYFGGAFAQDSAGNYSDTTWGNGIYIDTQIPDTGFIVDGNWIMDVDYTPDSSQLSYRWENFSDNVGLEYFQLAIGIDGEQANIMPFTNIGFSNTDTITGLSLGRDILYTTFLKAIDSAGNTSETVETDGIYFDDVFPVVTQKMPEVDSSQVVSVLTVDTLNIQFNKLLWDFNILVTSSQWGDVSYSLIPTDSSIVIALEDVLPSFDTITVVVDSAMAYNLLTVSDTLQFFSELWGDLNHDFAIDVQDVIAFNDAWPNVDLAPFDGAPPYVTPSLDGEVNLRDLAAFGQMWNWYYQDYQPVPGAIMTMGVPLEAVARVQSLTIQLPEGTTTGQITFSDPTMTKVTIKNMSDFSNHMVLTHYDSTKGIQSTTFSHLQKSSIDYITFSLAEVEEGIFQTSVLYQFFDREGQALSSGFSDLALNVLPEHFAVHPNFPNPFNSETRLKIDIPNKAIGDMKIYDILGREIYHRHLGELNAGFHEMKWDGKNTFHESVGTGIYFLKIQVDQDIFMQKMLLLK